MINSITIHGTATFLGNPQVLANLSKFNFLFGANGAGKTTISNVIANENAYDGCSLSWDAGQALKTVVYNRDFVEKSFVQSPMLKGVFTLGEGAGENIKLLETAKKEESEIKADIILNKNKLLSEDRKTGLNCDLATNEAKFLETCWKQKNKHDQTFQRAFEGLRNSKEKFRDRAIKELEGGVAQLLTLPELQKKAETIFQEMPMSEAILSELDFGCLIATETKPILNRRVLGKDDVDIASMIRKLGNSDWVRAGRSYFDANDNVCPFCQQKTEEDFNKSLNEYFDETFEAAANEISILLETYENDSLRLKAAIELLLLRPSMFLDVEKLKSELELLVSKTAINVQKIRQKKREPSESIELDSIGNLKNAIDDVIKNTNAQIVQHNKLVENYKAEYAQLVSEVWKYLLDEIKDQVADYNKTKAGLKKGIKVIEEKISELEAKNAEKIKAIQELEKKSTSVKPTLDEINKILDAFGFTSFALAMSDDEQYYKLIRSNGEDAKQTLSEGEKSFVTFLYFFQLLKGSEFTTGLTDDRVVVIDDPVSSLDSDVLFIVSSLIKELLEEVRTGSSYTKQIFVLTHNIYFHKEITYKIQGTPPTYWVVRKSGNHSIVENYKDNPISSSYELLWNEIKRNDISNSTIQNVMRRILEHYFKLLGSMDFDDICTKFDGKDKTICKSLISWAHCGSHGIPDDLFVSDAGITNEKYKDIFKQIFIRNGHHGHYKMMMREVLENEIAEDIKSPPNDNAPMELDVA
jgi:wobble nucleotide-excising tRNase